jgi:hypothetical protein
LHSENFEVTSILGVDKYVPPLTEEIHMATKKKAAKKKVAKKKTAKKKAKK